MKTIKNSKEVTTLELGDVVMFGDLKYYVHCNIGYFLNSFSFNNDQIFTILNISKRDFIENLGINILSKDSIFPDVQSLEALTAIVSALFKEYEKQDKLPETWKEFCERNPIQKGECYIRPFCQIHEAEKGPRNINADRNYFTSKQEAEAFLALMQLRQLHKAYVKDWEPDWTCSSPKFCIIVDVNTIRVADHYFCSRNLSFPTEKLANQFLTNFKDLLEIAKPLL